MASLVMLAVLSLVRPLLGFSVPWLLSSWGSLVFHSAGEPRTLTLITGLALDLLVGALLGLLFAVSQQQRIPRRGQLAVGIWYGILIWFVARLLAHPLLSDTVYRAVRSWPWLVGCLTFGISLALATIVYGKQRPGSAGTVVRD